MERLSTQLLRSMTLVMARVADYKTPSSLVQANLHLRRRLGSTNGFADFICKFFKLDNPHKKGREKVEYEMLLQ